MQIERLLLSCFFCVCVCVNGDLFIYRRAYVCLCKSDLFIFTRGLSRCGTLHPRLGCWCYSNKSKATLPWLSNDSMCLINVGFQDRPWLRLMAVVPLFRVSMERRGRVPRMWPAIFQRGDFWVAYSAGIRPELWSLRHGFARGPQRINVRWLYSATEPKVMTSVKEHWQCIVDLCPTLWM